MEIVNPLKNSVAKIPKPKTTQTHGLYVVYWLTLFRDAKTDQDEL